jgi:hypothetical protein
MASQMLNDATIASGSVSLHRESASAPTMALRGTIFKSLLFLLVAIAFDTRLAGTAPSIGSPLWTRGSRPGRQRRWSGIRRSTARDTCLALRGAPSPRNAASEPLTSGLVAGTSDRLPQHSARG